MNKPLMKSVNLLNALGLVLSLGALPLVCSMTGCASSDNKQVVREHNDDWGITRRVKEALENNARHRQFADIRVETNNGVVVLTGYVNTEEQKRWAADIARSVPGAREVVNNIIVRSGS